MTDFSFFDPQSDDSTERSSDGKNRFACSRRFVDLTHTVDGDAELSHSDDFPAHSEILELIESLLVADPNLQPSSEVQASERPHAIFLPEHYEAGYAYPLIVWFHGDGASEAELSRVMPTISDRNYIGVALRGDVTSGTGYSWSAEGARSAGLLEDIRQIVTSMRREYHIHSERIYLAGFGSGATTSIQLMLSKPEWFGGVISFSGAMPKCEPPTTAVEDLKDKRILLATSLGSTTTPLGDVVATGRFLYSVGMQVGTRVYQGVQNTPTNKMLRDLDSWLMDDICGNVKV